MKVHLFSYGHSVLTLSRTFLFRQKLCVVPVIRDSTHTQIISFHDIDEKVTGAHNQTVRRYD